MIELKRCLLSTAGGLCRVRTGGKGCSKVLDLILSAVWDLCPPTLSHKKPDVQHDFMVMDVRVARVGGKPN